MKRLKKGTPGKGGESPRDAFSHTPVGHGLKNAWTGYIAGETYWCQAHEHKPPVALGTKPCLTWMTDGALPCARCKPRVLPTWIGYVPVYREVDHEPCIVIVHESVMDVIANLRYATRVWVGRTDAVSSVYVRRTDDQKPVWKSTHEQRQGPRDITPDLLAMWGIPMLEQWLRGSDSPVSLPNESAPAAGEGPMVGAVDALQHRWLKAVAESRPSTNGKHKPEG